MPSSGNRCAAQQLPGSISPNPEEIAMTELTRRAALAGVAATTLIPLAAATPVRAAAPLADKQNASFYRYNVGTHQVTVVLRRPWVRVNRPILRNRRHEEEIGKVFADIICLRTR